MNRSTDAPTSLPPAHSALQHGRAPRPLPLFLEMVRLTAERDPALARRALAGLAAYEAAEPPPPRPERPAVARAGPASLRDYGGSGPPVVLVPSLINPPSILDLDEEVSLTSATAAMGRRVLLVDWGEARRRGELSVAGHVGDLLLPLLGELGERPALVGYCLGGTMAVAAANLVPVERVATLAAPWHFVGYAESSRDALANLWRAAKLPAESLGALPMEVLQGAFWSLDPERTVTKFARFGALDPADPRARRFVTLENWANEGEPLPIPAARELIEDLFGADVSGSGEWRVAGRAMTDRLPVPILNIIASHDRISPPQAAPDGDNVAIQSGHVGMVVGSARSLLHEVLGRFLGAACR